MGQGKSAPVDLGPPTAINIADFLRKDVSILQSFVQEMKQRGFVIFSLDQEHQRIIQEYLSAGKEFFSLPSEAKNSLAEIDDLAGKKNRGYVNVSGVKEFLKLKQSDAKQLPESIQNAVPTLQERFNTLNDLFLSLALVCVQNFPLFSPISPPSDFKIFGLSGVDVIGSHEPDGATGPYMDPKLKSAVLERIPQRSSVSFIHYLPRDEPSKRSETGPSSALDENGMNIPSKIHTDTGIMTLILCNDVPGLMVENRQKAVDAPDRWFEVENMFEPHKYLFCILGNKTELFALKPEFALKPTVHQVAIPYGVERHSLLYFVDVPQ